jgi:PAS domain S-box-containing protein
MSKSRPSPGASAPPAPAGRGARHLDSVYAGLARLAARICQAPIASISIPGCQVCWSTTTGPLPAAMAPAQDPFSAYANQAGEVFEVRNAAQDARFSKSECVTGPLAVRWYAGTALRMSDGEVAGTLAVYDTVLRQLSSQQREALGLVAQQAAARLDLFARLAEQALLADARPTPIVGDSRPLASALIESAPVAIYHTEGTGNLTYVNPEYRRIFGLKPDQLANDWAQGVHPDDRERLEQGWKDFCAVPQPMQFDYRSAPRDGAFRFLAERIVAIEGATGFVGTVSDCTDLVAAQGKLRQVETLYRDTFEEAPVGIAYEDPSGKILRCNRAFSDLLGYTAAELVGQTVGDLTIPDDVALTSQEQERLWKNKTGSFDIEKRYRRKDGSVLWVRVTAALVQGSNGAPECSVEFVRDISARKEMAAQLQQNKTLLETVIADLPLALLACDVDGRITHFNPAAAEMLSIRSPGTDQGLPAEYPLAAEVFLADGVTPVKRTDRPLARALRGKTVRNIELVIAPRGCPPRTTLSSARRLVGPDGQTMGAVAVIQDITERKQADLELERVHKELVASSRQAGMAEVATNVLHNVGNILNSVNVSASLVAERIKQSKAPGLGKAAALLQAQGADIGQFLTSDERGKRIPEYLATLGEQLIADQKMALDELTSLRENLEHIKDTVAMQQNYAKLLGVTETVNPADLVEDSLRLNAGAFIRHGVTVHKEFNAVPEITVDKHKVLQILVNLVRNAKYACDDSGRKDKALTLRVDGNGKSVRISVIDNGVGIPKENMDKLFTHGFTTRKAGHGFGLHSGAIAAQQLGGSLRAESDGPGCGATFILELPIQPPDVKRG